MGWSFDMDEHEHLRAMGGLEGRQDRSICVPRSEEQREDQERRPQDGKGSGSI